MRLALGPSSFDITTRALVVGILGDVTGDELLERAEQSCTDGADILELSGESLSSRVSSLINRFDVPVCVSTPSPTELADASVAGAVMARPQAGDPGAEYLAVVAAAGTTVVVARDHGEADDPDRHLTPCAELVALARRCQDAGVTPAQIVVDCGPSARRRNRIVALGYPVLVTAPTCSPTGGNVAEAVTMADLALALIDGCRLVRTDSVRQARRVADTLAAVMQAR